MKKDTDGVKLFFEKPGTFNSLSIFRILISAYCIVYAFFLYPDYNNFLADDGWLNWDLSQTFVTPWSLHIKSVAVVLQHVGIAPADVPAIVFFSFLISAIFLLAGLFSKTAAVVCWLSFWVMATTMKSFMYGLEVFLQVALFYMVVMPVNRLWSVDNLLGFVSSAPSWSATLSKRILQIHICLIYYTSGVAKLQNPAWHDGNAIWFSLMHMEFSVLDFSWMSSVPILPMVIGWAALAIEILYLIFMWIPRIRSYWFILVVLLHLGIGIFMSMPMFAALMIIFSFCAWYDDLKADAVWYRWMPIKRQNKAHE